MVVLVMSYSREHGNGTAPYRRTNLIIIEAGKVQLRTAATQNQHGIIPGTCFGCSGNGLRYGRRSRNTLHHSLEEVRVEGKTVIVFVQMTHEIPVTCRVRRRDDGKPVRQRCQCQPLLTVQQSLPPQPFNGLLPLALLVPDSIFRVNVVDYQ